MPTLKGLYLRTVYFLGFTSGGSVTHTSGVVNAMARQTTLDLVSNDELPGVQIEPEIISPILRRLPFFNEVLFNFKVIRKLKNRTGQYQFLYQRFSGESFCGAALSKRWRIPFVLEFNSSEVWKLQNWSRGANPLKNAFKKYIQLPVVRRIEHYNLQTAAHIVVVSDTLKENLISEGVEPTKILVNPNGVDVAKFDQASGAEIRQQFQFGDDFVFGFIGTFGKWHGVLELAEAIVLFQKERPHSNVRFLIIGDGKLYPEFKTILESAPEQDKITLTGSIHQRQGPEYLKACDAFLSPHIPNPDGTKFFGSPTKLFEYMACSKPIIASDLDQIGEILTHEKTALLCTPGDVSDLVHRMMQLLDTPSLQQTLGVNARKLVELNYSWDVHVSKILSVISPAP